MHACEVGGNTYIKIEILQTKLVEISLTLNFTISKKLVGV